MAKETSNFGFVKPDINDFYDVNVQNENWDKVDEQLGGTLPISRGGTGATNSSEARENLGIRVEQWTFTLEDGSTVTKAVHVG
jgi:hypothetical protein